jgi:hypothetical protein
MSNDLIAWVVAITLGIAVVVLGLRRNLSETTRKWAAMAWRGFGAGDGDTGVIWG